MRVEIDRIDALESREIASTEIFGDERAIDALVDMRIGADGDDEQVALVARELEMLDMPGVNDVETAMTVDKGASLSPSLGTEGKQFVAGENLACGHAVSQA
jgi:hypothetical protein